LCPSSRVGRATRPASARSPRDSGLGLATVAYHVSVLVGDGSLHRGAGQPRTIVEPAGPATRAEGNEIEIPLIGQIAAGVPVDAVELAEDSFLPSRRLVGHGNVFMLQVKGDSMTGAAIIDGDLVVVRRQQAAENGEIVAAQLDGTATDEATVKTLQRIDGHAWLMPHNPAYQPIPADWVPRHADGSGLGPESRNPFLFLAAAENLATSGAARVSCRFFSASRWRGAARVSGAVRGLGGRWPGRWRRRVRGLRRRRGGGRLRSRSRGLCGWGRLGRRALRRSRRPAIRAGW
jgi:repressor LexA